MSAEALEIIEQPVELGIPEVSLRYHNQGRRIYEKPFFPSKKIPEEVLNFLSESSVEHMVLLTLGTDLKIINYSVIAKGTINCVSYSVMDILRTCLLTAGCYSCMILHNHVSNPWNGDIPNPSPADEESCQRITEALKLMGITIVDFAIVGPTRKVFSFRDNNMLYKQTQIQEE